MPYFQVDMTAHVKLLIEADTQANAELMAIANTNADYVAETLRIAQVQALTESEFNDTKRPAHARLHMPEDCYTDDVPL